MKILSSINFMTNGQPCTLSYVQKNICDDVVCDSVCSAIWCDEAMCDKVCDTICDKICDTICDKIDTYAEVPDYVAICETYKTGGKNGKG